MPGMDQVRTIAEVVAALKIIGVEGPAVAADVLAAIGGYSRQDRDEILRRMADRDHGDPGE